MGLFGGGNSSSKQTTTASQTTSNSDNGSSSNAINLSGMNFGKKSNTSITVQTLDAGVVKNALASNVATTGAALTFAGNTTNRAFDSLDKTGAGFLKLLETQQLESQYAAIRANDLAGSVSRQVLDLADEKTTSTDERLIGLVKIGLAVVAVIVAAVVLFPRRLGKKKVA